MGKVIITIPLLEALKKSRDFNHPIITGICRNAFIENLEPPLVDLNFLNDGYKNYTYPKTFKEKAFHLLKYMYNNGGSELKEFNLQSNLDYTICYCDGEDEFNRIVTLLQKDYLVEVGNGYHHPGNTKLYLNSTLSRLGIEEVEKELPKNPMITLVDQVIATGDYKTDIQINYAKRLFFQEPQSLDSMRSACETLSYVLEPLREKSKKYFKEKDVEDFFQIVNTFDIRHNKDHTKEIVLPEQLEWVFYGLLNTINTYTKLIAKYS